MTDATISAVRPLAPASVAAHVPATPLPAFERAIPTATARRYRGWSGAWLLVALGAVAAAAAGAPSWLQTGAAGLVLPGGGFFADGRIAAGIAVLALFGIAIFVWWAIGTVVLPPLVWLTASAVAAATAGGPVGASAVVAVAATPAALAGATYLVHRVRFARQRRRGRAINEALAAVTFPITAASHAFDRPLIELSPEDLAFQRFAFDLALQPLDRFDGFVEIDQFREAALRYQLFFLGYTLSLAQYNSTPAFSGYLAEAQRNAIEKILDRRVWGYWALENAWGRLSLKRDPVDTVGNVMLTGYLGTQLGMYESLNDRRYSQPGALTFRWSDGERYPHSYASIADSVIRNVEGTDFALYPCEPNWIYTVCNAFALGTMVSHDRLHGTDLMARGGARLRHGYEHEFLRPDGRVIGMRSKHLGLTWNFWTGTAVQMTTAFWLHPSLPDHAQRTWWLVRPDLQIQDGMLRLPAAVSAKLDPGNYAFGSDHYAMSIAEVAAREMGDDEIAAAARRTIEAQATVLRSGGAARYEGMSTFTALYSMLGRWMREGSLRDLVAFGEAPSIAAGPRLAEAPYPDALVARAGTDGRAIELVLYPGDAPGRSRLLFDRLVPEGTYRVDGGGLSDARLRADAEGRLEVDITLSGRTDLRVRPS